MHYPRVGMDQQSTMNVEYFTPRLQRGSCKVMGLYPLVGHLPLIYGGPVQSFWQFGVRPLIFLSPVRGVSSDPNIGKVDG